MKKLIVLVLLVSGCGKEPANTTQPVILEIQQGSPISAQPAPAPSPTQAIGPKCPANMILTSGFCIDQQKSPAVYPTSQDPYTAIIQAEAHCATSKKVCSAPQVSIAMSDSLIPPDSWVWYHNPDDTYGLMISHYNQAMAFTYDPAPIQVCISGAQTTGICALPSQGVASPYYCCAEPLN